MKGMKKILVGALSLVCVFATAVGLTSCQKMLDKITEIIDEKDEELKKSEGLEYALSEDGTYYSVVGIGECKDEKLVIPSTYEGLPVTSIGNSAFSRCRSLTSVVIPDGVTSIGNSAFPYCNSLTSIIVDENNKNYKDIDGNLYSKDGTILIQYAIGKTATSFTIPDSVTSIGNYAFSDCNSLTSVVIGDSVTSIGDSAFEYCYSLTSVVIGDSVTSIGGDAFKYCSSLTSVVIGDSVTSIGNYAFYDCNSLTSVYITDIAAWCAISFDGYYANPLDYANNLYLNNELVTDLVIPDGVTSIGAYAFENCRSLTSVVIPDSVMSIGLDAFSECTNLRFSEYGKCKYLGNENNPYHALIQASNQNYSNYTIHEDTKVIAGYAFYNCSRIVSIVIPDSVTSIGNYAFYNCSSLTSVVIGNGVTSIGVYTFYHCGSFTSVYYKGTTSKWNEISIDWYNDDLISATLYYYSESAPTEEGDYWHYDENGEIAVW